MKSLQTDKWFGRAEEEKLKRRTDIEGTKEKGEDDVLKPITNLFNLEEAHITI